MSCTLRSKRVASFNLRGAWVSSPFFSLDFECLNVFSKPLESPISKQWSVSRIVARLILLVSDHVMF